MLKRAASILPKAAPKKTGFLARLGNSRMGKMFGFSFKVLGPIGTAVTLEKTLFEEKENPPIILPGLSIALPHLGVTPKPISQIIKETILPGENGLPPEEQVKILKMQYDWRLDDKGKLMKCRKGGKSCVYVPTEGDRFYTEEYRAFTIIRDELRQAASQKN